MRALIAMSGGVDSSVAARMMASQGYDCVGCTMRLYENDVVGMDLMDTCCSLENTQDARGVTEKIGIPYHIVHYENLFRQEVIEPFIDEYLHGRTPNPCIECNRKLKFEHLYEKMKELGCDILVTGHYARVRYDKESGRYQLLKAVDPAKDQSYVLYVLTQEQLAHVQLMSRGRLCGCRRKCAGAPQRHHSLHAGTAQRTRNSGGPPLLCHKDRSGEQYSHPWDQ